MKETFQALHPVDVETFFEGLNLLQDIKAERIRCYVCGDTISVDNFRAVTRKKGELRFACSKQACLEELALIEA
jgi:hypothetical protein